MEWDDFQLALYVAGSMGLILLLAVRVMFDGYF